MQIPQVPDRVKEAPAQALRAVFAGIGRLLLVADRIRNSAPDQEPLKPPATEPPATEPPATEPPATEPPSR
jgi:hypothetical protein